MSQSDTDKISAPFGPLGLKHHHSGENLWRSTEREQSVLSLHTGQAVCVHVHQSLRCPRSLAGLEQKASRWNSEVFSMFPRPGWASVFTFRKAQTTLSGDRVLVMPCLGVTIRSSTPSHPHTTPLTFLKAALIQSQVSLK